MDRLWKFQIEAVWNQRTIEDFLRRHLNFTRRQISSLKFMEDGIRLNGQKARTTCRLHTDDRLTIHLLDRKSGDKTRIPSVSRTAFSPVVLYEDEDLLVADKPAGLPVHPSHGHYGDTLLDFLRHNLSADGSTLHPVGRLDKDTAGIVIIARHRASAAALSSQLQNRQMEKTYLALAEGTFESKAGEITAPIAPREDCLNQMEISEKGKPAVTSYQVQKEYFTSEKGFPYSLLTCRLKTGRTHQIRVHMACTGHPLLGDPIYGITPNPLFPSLGLCAFSCSFYQPFTKKRIQVTTKQKEWCILWNEFMKSRSGESL